MDKYINHIYMEICHVTLDAFKGSAYNSYRGYCQGLLRSINENTLSWREKRDLELVFQHLELIFGMSDDENNKHIIGYLSSDRYLEFEKVVRLTKDLFPFTGG
jgi:hypothetical protein